MRVVVCCADLGALAVGAGVDGVLHHPGPAVDLVGDGLVVEAGDGDGVGVAAVLAGVVEQEHRWVDLVVFRVMPSRIGSTKFTLQK